MDMKTLNQQARERMNGACKVCRVCNGLACAGELPGMGGIRSGKSFMANREALDRLYLKMRVIHDVRQPVTKCRLLGLELGMPVMIAPLAGTAFNMGNGMEEKKFAQIVVGGAKQSGIIACTGDGTREIFECGLEAIRANGGWGIPVIKPWLEDMFFERLTAAANCGATVIGMDIDACAITALAKSKRPVSPKNSSEIKTIVNKAHACGLKFMLKGILSVEDALAAQECGCDAIVVSNHGGRALEALPGTAQALDLIAQNVRGMTILVDGGIRCGADILKMLALGANGVLMGRPAIIAAMGGEEAGIELFFSRLQRQLVESMILTGCPNVADADKSLLYQPAF